ncbi:hypothetical protein Barb7_02416 [Bacteroidales bacterium Barb7]|nr:hypothetical protein Barb7_02416 [Bacteroidales bacterium Barb7]
MLITDVTLSPFTCFLCFRDEASTLIDEAMRLSDAVLILIDEALFLSDEAVFLFAQVKNPF